MDLPIWQDFYQLPTWSMYDKLMTAFRIAGDQHPICFVDYSLTAPLPKRAHVYKDVLDFWQNPLPPCTDSFADVMGRIVTRIIRKVEESDSKLAVWYSGGTDSVCLLSAVLKNSSPAFQQEKMLIRMSQESIEEYPWYYECYIKDKLPHKMSRLVDYFEDGYYNVDGVFGDTVFGEHYIPELQERGFISKDADWLSRSPSNFHSLLLAVLKNRRQADWMWEQFERLGEKYNAENVFDLFWLQGAAMNLNQLHWMPFLLDYAACQLPPSVWKDRFYKQYDFRVFSSVDMFVYAFNHRYSDRSNIRRARIDSHLYSLDFTGDQDYFDTKPKVSSQIKLYESTPYGRLSFPDFRIEPSIIYRV